MSSRLAAFIRAGPEPILQQWEDFAATLFNSAGLDKAELRDRARQMLFAIADDLDTPQSESEQAAKSKGMEQKSQGSESAAAAHGAERQASGFSMLETVSEFRALRASVESLWTSTGPTITNELFEEFTRFHESIDQALTESLQEYDRQKEKDLRLFGALLAASPDPIFVMDTECTFSFANKATAELFGMDSDALIGQSIFGFGCAFPSDLKQNIENVTVRHSTFRGKFTHTLESGEAQIFDFTLAPVLDSDHNIEGVVCVSRDITQHEIAEEKVWQSAHHDELTGLPNRRLFLDRLNLEVKHAKRSSKPLALLYIDLDDFKEVNDSYGHEAGDRLLRAVADRINDCVREEDTVARIGGDEFTVILTGIERHEDAEVVAQSIIDALAISFEIEQWSFHMSASVGIALYNENASSPEELVKAADQAMYEAKKSNPKVSCTI